MWWFLLRYTIVAVKQLDFKEFGLDFKEFDYLDFHLSQGYLLALYYRAPLLYKSLLTSGSIVGTLQQSVIERVDGCC